MFLHTYTCISMSCCEHGKKLSILFKLSLNYSHEHPSLRGERFYFNFLRYLNLKNISLFKEMCKVPRIYLLSFFIFYKDMIPSFLFKNKGDMPIHQIASHTN